MNDMRHRERGWWALFLLAAFISTSALGGSYAASRTAQSDGKMTEEQVALMEMGISKVSAGEYEEALKLFDACCKAAKRAPLPFLNRGKLFLIMGKLDKAAADVEKAIKLDPSLQEAHLALGIIERMRGDYDRGIKELNIALEMAPNDPSALMNRAQLFFDAGRADLALEDLSKVLESNPRMLKALENRAYILEQLGRYDDEISDLTTILTLQPDHLQAMKHLGYAHRQKGDVESALRWFKNAVKLERNDVAKNRLLQEIEQLQAQIEGK